MPEGGGIEGASDVSVLGAVTGANGFIGRSVCMESHRRGIHVRGIVRSCSPAERAFPVGSIGPDTDWTAALKGVDWIIHCAALAHVTGNSRSISLHEYRKVNVAGTRALGEQAAAAGVRRLVFVSSIGVLGNRTNGRAPFRADDVPNPVDDYAASKLEAENALREIATRTGLELVIVRPPLVYGPGAPGNFRRLMGLIMAGVPLPFGWIDNRRSMVGVENLVDLLLRCTRSAEAAGSTFLVSDGVDLSTKELVTRLACAVGRRPRLVPIPAVALRLGGTILGRRLDVDRLIGSLQVDITYTKAKLGWSPTADIDRGLTAAARSFEASNAENA